MLAERIANELLLTMDITKRNQVSFLGEQVGYQPILIINALYAGVRDGKFTWDQKRDVLTAAEGIDYDSLALTDGLQESLETVEEFIANHNSGERDIWVEQLHSMIPNIPSLHLNIILRVSKKLATYEMTDPLDKKSVYKFVTLKENASKLWGSKQFDEKKIAEKKLKKRSA